MAARPVHNSRCSAVALVALVALGGCGDPALERPAYCQEVLSATASGCGVAYTACASSFACSWHVTCSTDASGSASCSCVSDTSSAQCHLGPAFTTGTLCIAAASGDRAGVRAVVIPACLGVQPGNIDFSSIH
ncbi:MAG: hypothetical protein E6J90_38115 [Deltaproteobacteria bacterium]|nr:MAG: hypothetical protein E6J90_38115 [Deltaproteobacteria bacterium]